jgi:hypothetical protein
MGGSPSSNHLKITATTWTQQSHGLFDYSKQNRDIKVANILLEGSANLYRSEQNAEVTQNCCAEEADGEQLLCRIYNTGGFWIFHRSLVDETLDAVLEKSPEQKLWLVVAQNTSSDFDFPAHKLSKNDLFKVGRVRFKIREIVSNHYLQENSKLQEA